MENEKTKYVVCLSGGKDSVYLLIWLLEHGYRVDEVVHAVVMATDTISAEYPEMQKYFSKIEESLGIKITYLRKRISFEEQFYARYENGKRSGKIYGFPYTIGAWCQSRLKAKLLDQYFTELGPNHIRYVGITAEEHIRYKRLSKNCRAPLYENGITGKDCLNELRIRGLINPLYQKFKRLGCWFCPKQCLESLRILRRDYPELWQLLLKWDKDSPVPFKPNTTVAELEERFWLEDRSA